MQRNKTIAKRIEEAHMKFYWITFLCGLFMLIIVQAISIMSSNQLNTNLYLADKLIRLELDQLPIYEIGKKGGSIEIVDKHFKVEHLVGKGIIHEAQLDPNSWSKYLLEIGKTQVSASKNEISIAYDETRHYWMIVTFPAAIEVQLSMMTNLGAPDAWKDISQVGMIIFCYFAMIFGICYTLAHRSARYFTKPLIKLKDYTKHLEQGEYEKRLDEALEGEFGELQQSFDALAKGLLEKTQENEAMKKARDEMIRDISHDLKNPLTAILGYSEELTKAHTLSEEKRRQYLKAITANGERANGILNSLIQFSKLENPAFLLEKEEVDFCEFIRLSILSSLEEVELAGLNYECQIPEESIWVMMDPQQMQRVWDNLLGNAIKYTLKAGSIFVSVKKENKMLLFEMRDQGIGMSKEEAKHVFEPFVRNDQARNSTTGGSGLGLSIVKKIVEAHKGSVHLDTSPHKGCHFTIKLPCK